MGAWYTIGIVVGAGAAFGIAAAGVLTRPALAAVAAAVAAVVMGLTVGGWEDGLAGCAGAVPAALGAGPLVAGALRRGGTRGGTAVLLSLVAVAGAVLALIPVVGYLEAVAVPVFGLRLRRRAPERHAGLRTLARD